MNDGYIIRTILWLNFLIKIVEYTLPIILDSFAFVSFGNAYIQRRKIVFRLKIIMNRLNFWFVVIPW